MQWISWHSLKYKLFCKQKNLVLRFCKLVEILRVCTFVLTVKYNCCFFHKGVYGEVSCEYKIYFCWSTWSVFQYLHGTEKRLLNCPNCMCVCMTWFSYENTSLEWCSSKWFECLCFQLIWRSGGTMCQYTYPVTHLLLSLSSWLEEKPYLNCGSCYGRLTQTYDGFKTGRIIWTVFQRASDFLAVEACVCCVAVYSFSETFIGDYVWGRYMPFLHMQSSLACSCRVPLTSLWCHGLLLAAGRAQLSSECQDWSGVGELPTGALVGTLWQNAMKFLRSEMNLLKLHITISVDAYLVEEVSTCLVFPPTIQREKVASLEKKEQESSHKLDVWVEEQWLGLAGQQSLFKYCRACSMLYCLLILLWDVQPSYCTSFNGLIMVINETDVLHSVKEVEEWHFNPNICFALY